jgi:hypothetical protein
MADNNDHDLMIDDDREFKQDQNAPGLADQAKVQLAPNAAQNPDPVDNKFDDNVGIPLAYRYLHQIPGMHQQFPNLMASFPPQYPGQMPPYVGYLYGPMPPYPNPWPNYAYQHDQQAWQEPPKLPKATPPPSFCIHKEVKVEVSKNLNKFTNKVVARVNPTGKKGPVMGPSVVKVLKMVYKPIKFSTDKQINEVATSIDLPKDFYIGPVPTTNMPIYLNMNHGGQCQDHRFQQMQNLLLTSQAGIAYAFEYILKHPDDPTWETLTWASFALMKLQKMMMQLHLSSLRLATKNDQLKYLFVGNNAMIKLFGEQLFNKMDDEIQKLASDRAKIHSGR